MQAQLRLPFVFPFIPQSNHATRSTVARRSVRVANAGEYITGTSQDASEAVKLIQARVGEHRTLADVKSELTALLSAEGHHDDAAEQLLSLLRAAVMASKQ